MSAHCIYGAHVDIYHADAPSSRRLAATRHAPKLSEQSAFRLYFSQSNSHYSFASVVLTPSNCCTVPDSSTAPPLPTWFSSYKYTVLWYTNAIVNQKQNDPSRDRNYACEYPSRQMHHVPTLTEEALQNYFHHCTANPTITRTFLLFFWILTSVLHLLPEVSEHLVEFTCWVKVIEMNARPFDHLDPAGEFDKMFRNVGQQHVGWYTKNHSKPFKPRRYADSCMG